MRDLLGNAYAAETWITPLHLDDGCDEFRGRAFRARFAVRGRGGKELAQWLSSAVGESVVVKPVLALPGWYINRVARGPVQVISGRDAGYLARPDDQALSAALMQRIVHQIDARCRTVEPRAYARSRN